jgi:hypothetical protein
MAVLCHKFTIVYNEYMNEFTAKKLGEVLAFAEVGAETWNQGKAALVSVFGGEKVDEYVALLYREKDAIRAIADRASVLATVMGKLEKTGEKLRKMRDMYVGDEWDNPTELLEWSGFFEGAAVVHASLLQGAAEEMGHAELQSIALQSLNHHKTTLDEATQELFLIGHTKARG